MAIIDTSSQDQNLHADSFPDKSKSSLGVDLEHVFPTQIGYLKLFTFSIYTIE